MTSEEKLIEEYDVYVCVDPNFPFFGSRSWLITRDDGGYTLVLNPNNTWEQNRECVHHELAHLENDDLNSSDTADELEHDCHKH